MSLVEVKKAKRQAGEDTEKWSSVERELGTEQFALRSPSVVLGFSGGQAFPSRA